LYPVLVERILELAVKLWLSYQLKRC
jgi:hypothetical protein